MIHERHVTLRKKSCLALISAFVLFSITCLFCTHAEAAIPAAERQALIDLYNSTTGDSWFDNSGWKTPPLDVDGFAMPGSELVWYGVTVDTGLQSVTRIDLEDNNLAGSIPASIENLSNLYFFFAGGNDLSGGISAEFGNLNNLIYLDLSFNQLSSIPPELGNLSSLQELNLILNQLQ